MPASGGWVDHDTGARRPDARVSAEVAAPPIVLLGEVRDDPEHHRRRLTTVAAPHARIPNLALDVEAFPRRVRPVLDRWARGKADAEAVLDGVDVRPA